MLIMFLRWRWWGQQAEKHQPNNEVESVNFKHCCSFDLKEDWQKEKQVNYQAQASRSAVISELQKPVAKILNTLLIISAHFIL